MTGRVVHFEVPYDDGDRARAFYRDVFGWQIQAVPEFDYNFVQTGPADDSGMPAEPGFIGGGMFQRDPEIGVPIITIEVDDIEAALEAVAKNGGTTARPPERVGEMGIAAYFKDSEGNLMGVWQSLDAG